MNLLIDQLPESVLIGGVEWPIRWDYRYWVMFEILMTDPEISENEKFYRALDLCFEEAPPDLYAVKEAILNFYQCGQERKPGHGEAKRSARPYSFEHDGQYIYAAFWQQYRIDLMREHLHWWQFRALLNSISSRTLFGKIMEWRLAEIDDKMPAAEKERLLALKKQYSIPCQQVEGGKAEEITRLLMESGDVQGLL